jgi:phosphoglucomutase/phosphomannomutase
VTELGPEVHEAYIQANLRCSLDPRARGARIVFTGLHGLGRQTVGEVLARAGFDLRLEPTQAAYDGAFPNVPFRAPNPEVPRALDAACAYADQVGADVVMACDPDADRLGLAARHPAGPGGAWRVFSGNEIAALACQYVVAQGGRPHPLVIQTEVTSGLVSRVAKAGGARVIDHLLVGFKYIGDALHQLEEHGSFAGVAARLADFALGAEESHGLLVTPEIRDKDAAGGALMLAELASRQAAQGRTLVDALDELWRRVGYVQNQLRSVVMLGAEGRARIAAVMASLRADPPASIGGLVVTAIHDRQDPLGVFGPHRSDTDRASRDVLVYQLGPDARVVLRPSGTEPKSKVYVEVCGDRGAADAAAERARVDAEVQRLANSFLADVLGRVGLDLPAWALAANDLVAIEHKQDLAHRVLPELRARLDRGDAGPGLERWLDGALLAYGRDARKLVLPAVAAWAAQQEPERAAPVLALFPR